ncbi:MAG: PspA/IM30 family protein, partial [Planctomycetota bacterium]
MLSTLRVLLDGANTRAEDRLKDTYAVELIEQRIREAEHTLAAAKMTLASLIQRKRAETRLAETLTGRIARLTDRATEAIAADREDLAREAATAIAEMENEHEVRQATIARLDTRIMQLQSSVERAHRRIVDLKQGAIAARAVKREGRMQASLDRTLAGPSAADEAEAL